jgi:hypothetical protein
MKTIDGRDFLYMFIADSCGVDFLSGIPSNNTDEFKMGQRKPAIDLFNLMVYHCYEDFKKMLDEQTLRAKTKEKKDE